MAAALLRQGALNNRLPFQRMNVALLSETRLTSTLLCHPEHSNTAGRIFGGYLMRQAYEIASTNAYMFSGSKPLVLEVGEIYFHGEVLPGEMVRFESAVLY